MLSEKRSSMLHGVLLMTLFSCAAFYIGDMNFVKSISFSPMIVGIILGMIYANSLRNNLPDTWVPGIQFCSKRILRLGVILYGFKLTLQDITAVGLPAIVIDAIVVVITICGGVMIGRMLKMDRGIALLTSVGSGICGAAAILRSRVCHKDKTIQDSRGCVHCSDFRNAFHVSLSYSLQQWNIRFVGSTDGNPRWIYHP
jgi:uncharacterized integral membrane protein (TIGR00698 family)